MKKIWHLKTTAITTMIGTFDMSKRGTDKYIYMVPGNPCLQEIKKRILCEIAHLLKRVLSM